MKQLDGFTAARYDPWEWAALFARAGARYAVLTARHHDGVALWDTALDDLDVVRRTPAARDLVGPYAEALREQGLKVGLYYSHSDWNHPDYASVLHPRPTTRTCSPAAGSHPRTVSRTRRHGPATWPTATASSASRSSATARSAVVRRRVGTGRGAVGPGRTRRPHPGREPDTVLNARMLGHGTTPRPSRAFRSRPPRGPPLPGQAVALRRHTRVRRRRHPPPGPRQQGALPLRVDRAPVVGTHSRRPPRRPGRPRVRLWEPEGLSAPDRDSYTSVPRYGSLGPVRHRITERWRGPHPATAPW